MGEHMKIGIVTLWDAFDNYGGILQTFALQKYFRDQGHDAFVIRYKIKKTKLTDVKSVVKNVLFKLNLLGKERSENIKSERLRLREKLFALKKAEERKFDKFRDKNIVLSESIFTSLKDVKKNYPIADVYITGSDQVWGRSLNNSFEPFFYLDFGRPETTRIAYAASFGSAAFPCENESRFNELVEKFDRVSVRENEGVAICSKLGIKAERCIDPTFLLNVDVYESLAEPCKQKKPFAFFYTVNIGKSEDIYWDECLHLLKKKGVTLVVTTASGYENAKENFPSAIYDYATVGGWLANMKNAKIIFTSSFHGLVFAILFKKDFICLPLKGFSQRGNERLIDLLTLCGLQNRYAQNFDDVCKLIGKPIDYTAIDNSCLQNLIEKSKKFLEL